MNKLNYKNNAFISFLGFLPIFLIVWITISIGFIFKEPFTFNLKDILNIVQVSFTLAFIISVFITFVCLFVPNLLILKLNLKENTITIFLMILFIVDALLSLYFCRVFLMKSFELYDIVSISFLCICFYKFLNWYFSFQLSMKIKKNDNTLEINKLTFKNILLISFVAYIIFNVVSFNNYFFLVKNEGLPSFEQIDYGTSFFSGFVLILIFFIPLQLIFKFTRRKFNIYAVVTILILDSFMFLEAYIYTGTGYMHSTYETGTVFFSALLSSFPIILLSSILFYFFLKWYLKQKKDL